ncbi:MAG: metallophosphoesterase family protein [Clostridia bacterium]|nr:metallophosphoesterase family protein [Clostridia bacterium]
MKALIISDVHANIDALRSIVEAEPDADAIYCAGDVIDYGLNPSEVIAYIKEKNIHTVMGNHDEAFVNVVLEQPPHDMNEPFTFAQYNCSIMTDEEKDFIRNLPMELSWEMDGIEYFMTHRFQPNYEVIWSRTLFSKYWAEKYPNSDPNKEHRCIFGHTHRSCILTLDDDKLWLNPGSASYRRGDDPTKDANYAVIVDGKITLKTVPYPRKHLYDQVCAMNLTDHERRCGIFFFGDPE